MTAESIWSNIIEHGRGGARHFKLEKETPLMYYWHDSLYLGAAHGVTGILFELMYLRNKWQPSSAADDKKAIIETADYLLSLRKASGNFPSSGRSFLFAINDSFFFLMQTH
jgi:hypothetical protein